MHQPFFKRHYEKNSCVKYLLYAAIFLYSSHYVIANAPSLKTVNELSIKETSETDPPEYLINKLNLESMEGANSPVENIDILKQRLAEYNEDLKKREKPLIYLGLANKEEFFNTPYFLNRYKEGEASNEELAEGYSQKLGLRESRNDLGVELEDLTNMLKADYSNQSASLFSEEASSIDEKGIVITKYYYGLLKAGADPSIQSATVQWLSVRGYQLSPSLKGKLAIDETKLKTHYNSLKSLQENETLRLIEAWYNYLIDKELPKKQDADVLGIASLDTSDACRNLTKEKGDQKAAELINIIKDEKTAIAQRVLNTCYPVIESLAYEHKITAIRYLASGIVEDYKETAILRLIHSIPSSSFGAFFADLKAEKEGHILMTDLLSNIDDVSLLFQSYGENFTSLVEEFKRMGSANAGEQFKKERIYLLESLLGISPTISILEGIHSLATYELQPDETGYGDYLVKDDYKNLLRVFNYGSLGLSNRELLITSGNALGSFLVGQKKQAIFKELPEVIFSKPGDDTYDQIGIHVIAGLYKHLPNDDEAVYEYLSAESFTKLKLLIEKVHTVKASQLDAVLKVTTTSFYDGVTNLLDNKASIDDRTDLARWVLDKDEPLEGYRNFFLHIFDNIVASDDRKKVYDFLAKGWDQATVDYHYLKKITTKGVLSGDERQISFLKYFMGLINEHGSVLDREYLLRNVLREGDDFSYLKWHDTEDLVSVLFSNMSAEDGMYLQSVLSADSYQLFKEIWVVMENSILWTAVDRDNQRFEEFVMSFSKLFTKDSYNSVYGDNQSYLNINEKPSIESIGNHIPFVRTKTINLFGEHTDYSLTSEIEKDGAGSEIISIKVELGNEVLIDKKLAPFDPVFIEFIEDTEISPGVHFKIGDVILVPAFYVAWMDGSISSQNINSTLRVGADFIGIVLNGAAIVATVASGGALSPLLLFNGAEIVFSFADASIVMFEGELKEEFGEEFINKLEIANLIWGVANLPMAVTSGVVVIKTVSGKAYQSGKLAIKNIKGRILEVRIKPDELFKHLSTYSKKLSGLKSWDKSEMMETLFSIEAKMRAKVKSFSSNLSTADFEHYKIVKIALYAMYLDQVPELAQLVLAYPNKFKIDVVDRVLKMRYGSKTFCNITADGILQDINLVNISDGALLPNQTINNFQTGVKYGEAIIEDVLQVVVKQNGEPVFRRGFKKGFTRKGRLLNEYSVASPSTQRLLYAGNTDVIDDILETGKVVYVIEREDQLYPAIVAFNKEISSIDEYQKLHPDLEIWKQDGSDLVLKEYKFSEDVPIRGSVVSINGEEIEQYEFVKDWSDYKGTIEEVSIKPLTEESTSASIAPPPMPLEADENGLFFLEKGRILYSIEIISGETPEVIRYNFASEEKFKNTLNLLYLSSNEDGLLMGIKYEVLQNIKFQNDIINQETRIGSSGNGIYPHDVEDIYLYGDQQLEGYLENIEIIDPENPNADLDRRININDGYASTSDFSHIPNFDFFINDETIKAMMQEVIDLQLLTKYSDLLLEEITALRFYTREPFHRGFNSYLRGEDIPEEELFKPVQALMNSGLSKLQAHSGNVVYKGTYGTRAEIAKTWKVGDNIVMNDFVSTTTLLTVARRFMTDVMIEIHNPLGYDISSLSNTISEDEVLFKSGSNFIVKLSETRQIDGIDIRYIILEYIDESIPTPPSPVPSQLELVPFEGYVVPNEYKIMQGFDEILAKKDFRTAMNIIIEAGLDDKYDGVLTLEELAIINFYTKDSQVINPFLRGEPGLIITDYHRAYETVLNSALNKLPKVRIPKIYKGSLSGNRIVRARNWKNGEIINMPDFMSTSTDLSVSMEMASRNDNKMFFEITDSEGVDITEISTNSHESEILLTSKSEFLVVGKSKVRVAGYSGEFEKIILRHINNSSGDINDLSSLTPIKNDIEETFSPPSDYVIPQQYRSLDGFDELMKDPDFFDSMTDAISRGLDEKFPDLTLEELAIVRYYCSQSTNINPFLRNDPGHIITNYHRTYETLLNSALDKLEPDSFSVSYKGSLDGNRIQRVRSWRKGDRVNMPDFMSTSTDLDAALKFAETNDYRVFLEILNPEGVDVMDFATFEHEFELLLKSNSEFIVRDLKDVSIHGVKYKKVIIEHINDDTEIENMSSIGGGNTSQSSNTSSSYIESTPNDTPTPTESITVPKSLEKLGDSSLEFVPKGNDVFILMFDDGNVSYGKFKQFYTSETKLYRQLDMIKSNIEKTPQLIYSLYVYKYEALEDIRVDFIPLDIEGHVDMFEVFPRTQVIHNNEVLEFNENTSVDLSEYLKEISSGTPEGYGPKLSSKLTFQDVTEPLPNYSIPNEYKSLRGAEDFLKNNNLLIAMNIVIKKGIQDKFPQLTIEELGAIRYYTDMGHNEINPQLRNDPGKVVTDFQRAFEVILNSAIDKLPKSNAKKVYKGSLKGTRVTNAKLWNIGESVSMPDFVSTSVDEMVAMKFIALDRSDVLLVIEDVKGSDIIQISHWGEKESEILLKSKSEFIVIKKEVITEYVNNETGVVAIVFDKPVQKITLRQIN